MHKKQKLVENYKCHGTDCALHVAKCVVEVARPITSGWYADWFRGSGNARRY